MKNVAIIPARFASTRLPGKPLLRETGTPLVLHVVTAAKRATRLRDVIVATDDIRIRDVVLAHGEKAVMTRQDHPTGTDRVAEVAAAIPDADIVVNLQGDEPEISGHALDLVVSLLEDHPEVPMATLATPIRDPAVYNDPACVKVVLDRNARALYFSRSPIPHHRDGLPAPAPETQPDGKPPVLALLHLGLYAYRREFLLNLANLPPHPLENAEKLEQLRVLAHGHPILVGVVEEPSVGIDTPDDYQRFVQRWKAANPHST